MFHKYYRDFFLEIETNAFLEEAKLEPKSEEVYVVSGGVIDPPWDPPQTSSYNNESDCVLKYLRKKTS